MLDGTSVTLGQKVYVVPALNLKGVRKAVPLLNMIQGQGRTLDEAGIDALVTLAGLALRRNYPDLSDDEIEEHVDLRNMHSLLDAITGESKLEAQPLGEMAPGVAPVAS